MIMLASKLYAINNHASHTKRTDIKHSRYFSVLGRETALEIPTRNARCKNSGKTLSVLPEFNLSMQGNRSGTPRGINAFAEFLAHLEKRQALRTYLDHLA